MVAITTDLGPIIRRARGEVVVEDAADPDSPNRTIRRGRRGDPVLRLVLDGTLSQAEWLAAQQYRDDDAIAEGSREQQGGGGLAPWQRAHYTDRQLDAVRAKANALHAVGTRCGAVFVAIVGSYCGLRETERELGMRNGTAAGVVKKALSRLSDHYSGA